MKIVWRILLFGMGLALIGLAISLLVVNSDIRDSWYIVGAIAVTYVVLIVGGALLTFYAIFYSPKQDKTIQQGISQSDFHAWAEKYGWVCDLRGEWEDYIVESWTAPTGECVLQAYDKKSLRVVNIPEGHPWSR